MAAAKLSTILWILMFLIKVNPKTFNTLMMTVMLVMREQCKNSKLGLNLSQLHQKEWVIE